MIEARHLTKRYGHTVAVDEASFVVRPGPAQARGSDMSAITATIEKPTNKAARARLRLLAA